MSLRRNVRLRREYLYRKSLEGKERAIYERKKRLRECLREGKQIPTELRGEEAALREQLKFDDDGNIKPRSHVDDEYNSAGVHDPRICVTTSRDPSSRLKQFAKELRLVFPNCSKVNRGSYKVDDLVHVCRENNFTDLVMVQEHRGEPDGITICHLPYGPTAYFGLSSVVMRHDIEERGTVSEAYPHLILHNLISPLGQRVGNILKYLFPVPKPESKRVMTFANQQDSISFRHHVYRNDGRKDKAEDVELTEVGPRFEMKLYQIKLGTLDQPEAEDEWVLRPYMNTAKKRRRLGD